jgi:GTPase involved in cell partitioning and DNA repair
MSELKAYDERLATRRGVVILNKADLAEGEDDGLNRLEVLQRKIEKLDQKVFIISGATQTGLTELKSCLYDMVQQERAKFEAELASRLPVVKGLMSAAALGLEGHGMLDFNQAMTEGRALAIHGVNRA